MKRTGLFYWTLGIVIAAVAIMLAFYWDQSVVAFMINHQTPGMRNFMHDVSWWGDWPTHFVVGWALFAIALWRQDRKWQRIFLSMLIALAIAGLAGRAIKVTTGRARPSVKSEQMWNGPRWSDSKYHSFPSGHVDASVGFFAVLLLANWRIGLPCLAIPAVIGFSRIYLGAHYLSDVVCAAMLGILSAIVVVQFIQPRLGKQELPSPGRGD